MNKEIMKEMQAIEEVVEASGLSARDFIGYSGYSSYVDEVVHEISDGMCTVYNNELCGMSWELYQEGYTDRATEEFEMTELIEILQCAEFLRWGDTVDENLERLLMYYAMDELVRQVEDMEEFDRLSDEDVRDLIEEIRVDVCGVERLDDICDIVLQNVECFLE